MDFCEVCQAGTRRPERSGSNPVDVFWEESPTRKNCASLECARQDLYRGDVVLRKFYAHEDATQR